MCNLDDSSEIIDLSDDYANNLIGFFEYRTKRKDILMKLDKEFNHVEINSMNSDDNPITFSDIKNETNTCDESIREVNNSSDSDVLDSDIYASEINKTVTADLNDEH